MSWGSKKQIFFLILAEAVILAVLIIMILISNNEVIDTAITDWRSDYVDYDNGWYIDESIVETQDTIGVIYGPYIKAEAGSYSVRVEYECDYDQSCLVFASRGNDAFLKTGLSKLRRNQQSISYNFDLTEDIDNLEVVVKYDGKGALLIKSIEIRRNALGLQRMLAIAVLLSLCINICFYFRKYIGANKLLILKICGIILLVSCPLFARGIGFGHDMGFHLLRIEGLAEELRRGIFPVKMASLWMEGYGYPVSIYYGDIFLYIPAVLRIIGFSIVTTYKSYVFLVNIGTVIISYVCFKKIFKSEEVALLTSLAYATAGYRIVCIYVRSAVGEYSAQVFFPLIALAVYRFYTLDSEDWKSYKRYAFVLALGMTGVIGCHVLSTEMVAVTLALLCVVLWKSTIKKYIIRGYVLAVIETIALNLYFAIPFLDYYRNVEVRVNDHSVKLIQKYGTYIVQYFSFLQDMFGGSQPELSTRMNLSPGLALMAVLVIAVIIWVKGKATKEIKFYLSFSAFLLFVASDLFPWDKLAAKYWWGKMLSAVQFPWRYIGIAAIFMTMLLGVVYKLIEKEEGYRQKFNAFIVSACVIMCIFYTSNYADNTSTVYYFDTAEINLDTYINGEYLRTWTNSDLFSGEIIYENMQEVSLLSREGTYMELYCEASETTGTVELPILNYKGYQITDEYGNRYEIVDGENKVIQFSVPAGFTGKITVDFVEPLLWRLGEAVSLIAVMAICANLIIRYSKLRK